MNRLTTSLAIACGAALLATTANAETVDELKRELAGTRKWNAPLSGRFRLGPSNSLHNLATRIWTRFRIHLSAIPIAPGFRSAWACLGRRRSPSHCPMYGTREGTHFRLPLALATQASFFPKDC